MGAEKSVVVVRSLPPGLDLRRDYVALPKNYGSPAYYARPDIQAIQHLVTESLAALDERIHFTSRLAGRRVILKPNLVTVYHHMGLVEPEYPETTDPRLLDAVLAFFKRFTDRLVIAESSGRGVPTRGSFVVAGIDRLAAHYRAELIALEEQPVYRYLQPKAKVQKEVFVPEIFTEVISGEAFFVSLPKMKTNLFTGVTLGLKNVMGVLPYNLRQRQHHFAIDQKLVDLLHLVNPDLTIIDGLVGGEGNCPAPVDPVDSRVIVCGNNCMETDRVAARLMGFDPRTIPLLRLAEAAGFNDPLVEVVGDETIIPFRPADPSLMNEAFRRNFPNVRLLVGHELSNAPVVSKVGFCSSDFAQQMEMTCRGGCLAATRFAFDMFLREGQPALFPLVVLIGAGFEQGGQRGYVDHTGRFFTLQEAAQLPGKKLVVGSCSQPAARIADHSIEGCMPFPNSPHAILHRLTGTRCTVLSLKNRHLVSLLWATLRLCEKRKNLIRRGHRLDCALPDTPYPKEPLLLTLAEQDLPALRMDLPPLSQAEIRAACAAENRAMLATFFG